MKQTTYKTLAALFLVGFFLSGSSAAAGDLDDGISIQEESVSSYDDISQSDINIRYITIKAKAQANKNGEGVVDPNGDVVQGGAIIKSGANVKGDVIVIYEGDNNVVVGN